MKIFSNFDTQFKDKVISKRKTKFQDDEIMVVVRSKYYLLFRVILPMILYLIVWLVVLVFLGWYMGSNLVYVPLFLVWLLVVWFRVVRKLLKYLYDFTIIDPLGITTYKQKGILHSFLKQIPANRIRSIEIERSNLLENIFSYWKVNILTDFMENMHIWEDWESPSVIGMTHVDDPYKIKTRITDICFR